MGEVVDLFNRSRRFRAQFFNRIGSIALAQVINGQLDVNVNLVGWVPREWLEQLVCTVIMRKQVVIGGAPVGEVVSEFDDFALLVTDKSRTIAVKNGRFPAGTTVVLTDKITGNFRSFLTRFGDAVA